MKIILVGETSKVAEVISKSNIAQKNVIETVSQRKTNTLNNLEEQDAIIYLVSNTKTIVESQDYAEYIYSNCILLTKFILSNNIKNNNFIYFSTAKIYNVFPEKDIHTENDNIKNILRYTQLKGIAKKIIRLIYSNLQCDCNNEEFRGIVNEILKLPKINNYFPIYEYTKIISELIIAQLLKKAYILRPTYLYGDNEKNNIIYKLIEHSAKGEDIEMSSGQKDFVHYNTLLLLLEKIIEKKADKINIINVSDGKNIDNQTLQYFVDQINSIVNKKSNIKIIEKCPKNYTISNDKMKKIINEKFIENIEKSIRFMIYRYYIKEIRKLNILKEYIGGSFACSYLIKDEQDQRYILKVCIGNGADNGNLKMINEAKQMQAIYEILKDKDSDINVPEIFGITTYNDWTIIKEEYIEGKTYTDIFYENRNIDYLCEQIRRYCKLVCSVYNIDIIDKRDNLIIDSIERSNQRLMKVRNYDNDFNIFQDYDQFRTIQINNIKYQNPLRVLEKLKEKDINYDNIFGLCISGDSILDNLIAKGNKCYILDSRGEDLTWKDGKPYFDPYYDLGKILFYFVGWSTIRKESFSLETNNYSLKDTRCYINLNNDVQKVFDTIKNKCLDIFLESKKQLNINESDEVFKIKILLMAGVHFLSDTYPRIVGKGHNPINECFAEYIVGTMLINNLYSYMEGKIKSEDILKIG